MKGQALIEVLVAIAITVIIISASTVSLVSTLNNAIYSKNQDIATQYVQEGISILKSIQATYPNDFSTKMPSSGVFCLDNTCDTNNQITCTKDSQNCTACFTENPLGNVNSTACNLLPSSGGIAYSQQFLRYVTISNGSSNGCSTGEFLTVKVVWDDSRCRNPNALYCNSVSDSWCSNNYSQFSAP